MTVPPLFTLGGRAIYSRRRRQRDLSFSGLNVHTSKLLQGPVSVQTPESRGSGVSPRFCIFSALPDARPGVLRATRQGEASQGEAMCANGACFAPRRAPWS